MQPLRARRQCPPLHTPLAPVVTVTVIFSSSKIQNGDILIPASPGCHGQWSLNKCGNWACVLDQWVSEWVFAVCRDASGMVLHKESQWYQSWQTFKDNNQFVHSQSVTHSPLSLSLCLSVCVSVCVCVTLVTCCMTLCHHHQHH